MSRLLALISRGLILAGLWLAALISVFPFYWMVVGATNTAVDVTGGKVTFGYALGDNIAKFFELVDVTRVFFNSAVNTLSLKEIFSAWAAYKALTIACSISAPEKPLLFTARRVNEKLLQSIRRLSRCKRKISPRAA